MTGRRVQPERPGAPAPFAPAARVAMLFAMLALSPHAWALPTMIRLGYPNCASCHISPQGGGLLNAYGRGIDEAQSLRAGEYRPSESSLARTLSWGGRITQDIRTVTGDQLSGSTGGPTQSVFRTRWMYRNVTDLGKGLRVSAILTGENDGTPRPSTPYEHPVRPRAATLSSAMLAYRPREGLEFAGGRDLLPAGIYLPDQALFMRSRNRLGYYDTPTQFKMYWWGKRHQISPFVYGPSGNEWKGEAETGAGTLAEVDLLGKQRTVVGISLLRGSAHNGSRRLIGAYTRLGFGRWGLFAEHDVTDRTLHLPSPASFRQQASYVEWFWAAREWLVFSVGGERLEVADPYPENLKAAKFAVSARLTSNFTLGLTTRLQRNPRTDAWGPSAAVQLAFKTVN